jgi:predicted enzyme related to lactoylglutathione lyase
VSSGVFQRVDAVTVPVPDLESGLRFYADGLGHRLLWRNDSVGQAGLALPTGDSELVLTTRQHYEPNWLVDDVTACLDLVTRSGGTVVVPPFTIPVGRAAVIGDPFGNRLVVVDLSAGRYPGTPEGPVEPDSPQR